jgi:4-diphosphocytidyl-2-C-methyl-D-erythritol kinase
MMLCQKAFAKINLGLRILDRRPDGYHSIETIFVELAWGDTLHAEPAPELHFQSRGLPVPQDEKNLVMKAAGLLKHYAGLEPGARITLEKVIPLGSGLGGGSSDAAATLLLLSKLWNIEIEDSALAALARSLGADVPFFLKGGIAHATGIGDKCVPVDWGFQGSVVLFYPGWEISTPWAYQQWDLSANRRDLSRQGPFFPLPLKDYLDRILGDPECRKYLVNDFEPIVFGEFPALKKIYDQFWETGADYVGLSGSGSSLFGLFWDDNRAAKSYRWLKSIGWACLTRPRMDESRESSETG